MTHEPSELDVLTWGFEPADAERIGPDLMIAAVRWARQHYEMIIVDTHPGYDDRTVAMLSVANEILLTVTPEVGPLRNSAQFLQLAHELGIDDTIRVVANRANHGVEIADMEGALGRPVIATIVSAGATAVMAANSGTPLILRFPKERITADIHRLARVVAGTEEARGGRRFRPPAVLVLDPAPSRGAPPWPEPRPERHAVAALVPVLRSSGDVPTYDYRCRDCGHTIEIIHSILDDGPEACERCRGPLVRVLHPTGVIFRGSGFYVTDSRSSGGDAAPSTRSGGDGKGKDTKDSGPTSEKKDAPSSTGSSPGD